jgi:hypothetical protein
MPLIVGEATGNRMLADRARGRQMTISRKLTSITTAVALAAAGLGAVTTTASAGGYRGDGYRGGDHYSRDYDRHDDRGYRGGRDRYYAHKKRNNTGKYIAIGAAALMLGIIASEASRR